MTGKLATSKVLTRYVDGVTLVRADPARVSDLMAKAEALALNPDVLRSKEPAFFRAEASNGGLDTHFTRMAEDTLRNYVEDAQSTRVPVQVAHSLYSLGIGRALDGEFVEPKGKGGTARALIDWYTVPDVRTAQGDTTSIIEGLQTGLYRDVSVGFRGGVVECNICGNDMYSMRSGCTHWPGREYEVPTSNDPKDKRRTKVRAEGTVKGARLIELSVVARGSTPNAGVFKQRAQALLQRGDMSVDDFAALEELYHITDFGDIVVPADKRALAVSGGDTTSQPITQEDDMSIEERLRGVLTARGVKLDADGDLVAAVERSLGEVADVDRLRDLAGKYEAEKHFIELGKQARQQAIEAAMTEGKRAIEKFDEEAQRGLLEGLPLASIELMRSNWADIASKRFPGGRRSLSDGEANTTPPGDGDGNAGDGNRADAGDEQPTPIGYARAHRARRPAALYIP